MKLFIWSLVALLVAGIVGFVVLSYFGFINVGDIALQAMKHIKSLKPVSTTYELGLKNSRTLREKERELEDQRQTLELKQKEVDSATQDIEDQKKRALAELAQIEARKNASLQQVAGLDQIDKVAKVCASMEPEGAAKVLSGMVEADSAQVLMRLTDKQAGAILAKFDPKVGAKILTRIVRSR